MLLCSYITISASRYVQICHSVYNDCCLKFQRNPVYYCSYGLTLYIPMSIYSYVPMSLCPYVPLSLCPYVPLSLCPYVPMSLCPYVIRPVCPNVHVSVCPYATKMCQNKQNRMKNKK